MKLVLILIILVTGFLMVSRNKTKPEIAEAQGRYSKKTYKMVCKNIKSFDFSRMDKPFTKPRASEIATMCELKDDVSIMVAMKQNKKITEGIINYICGLISGKKDIIIYNQKLSKENIIEYKKRIPTKKEEYKLLNGIKWSNQLCQPKASSAVRPQK